MLRLNEGYSVQPNRQDLTGHEEIAQNGSGDLSQNHITSHPILTPEAQGEVVKWPVFVGRSMTLRLGGHTYQR